MLGKPNGWYDAVEPDNIDGWENNTGAVLQKNDPEQATSLQSYFDGVLDEQCNEYSECSSFQPYLSAGKPMLNAEYKSSLYPGFCRPDKRAGIMGAVYDLALGGKTYRPCWATTPVRP